MGVKYSNIFYIYLTLLETAKQILKMVVSFYILTAMCKSFSWSIDSTFGAMDLFDYSLSGRHTCPVPDLQRKYSILYC